MKNISFIVVPAMIFELGSGLVILYYNIQDSFWFFISMLMLITIWIITAVFFTALHGKLTRGYDRGIVDSLVRINWIRTGLWTTRLIIIFYDMSL
tara:strand:- start:60 stop:344 length:285 start_codon:yes stop_codon:yes gene_type:complete